MNILFCILIAASPLYGPGGDIQESGLPLGGGTMQGDIYINDNELCLDAAGTTCFINNVENRAALKAGGLLSTSLEGDLTLSPDRHGNLIMELTTIDKGVLFGNKNIIGSLTGVSSAGSTTLTKNSHGLQLAVDDLVHITFGSAPTVWTNTSHPKAITMWGVHYSVNQFVAVGYPDTDTYVITSPDGITWTERATPKAGYLYKVFHNGYNLWVAVGDVDGTGDAYMISSPDGITWTERANPQNIALYDVTYVPWLDLWIAVGDNTLSGCYIITSPDGINWTYRDNPRDDELFSVTHNGYDQIVAVGNPFGITLTSVIYTSPDGINWTLRESNSFKTLNYVAYGNGLYVAVGYYDSSTDTGILTSPDGIEWTHRTHPKGIDLYSVAYRNNMWVAAGDPDTDAYLITSPDGITWTEQSNPNTASTYGLTYSQDLNLWVGVGGNFGGTADSIIRASQDDGFYRLASSTSNTLVVDSSLSNTNTDVELTVYRDVLAFELGPVLTAYPDPLKVGSKIKYTDKGISNCAGLPGAGDVGKTAFVTDAASGSNAALCCDDGTSWLICDGSGDVCCP